MILRRRGFQPPPPPSSCEKYRGARIRLTITKWNLEKKKGCAFSFSVCLLVKNLRIRRVPSLAPALLRGHEITNYFLDELIGIKRVVLFPVCLATMLLFLSLCRSVVLSLLPATCWASRDSFLFVSFCVWRRSCPDAVSQSRDVS